MIELKDTVMEKILENLRLEKYRIGKVRRDLIKVLNDNKHFNVEELIQELKKMRKNVNVAAIYNNLNFLLEKGFIKKTKFKNNPYAYYELKTELHAHLVCNEFKKIMDVDIKDLSELKDKVEEKYDFEVFEVSFDLYGRYK